MKPIIHKLNLLAAALVFASSSQRGCLSFILQHNAAVQSHNGIAQTTRLFGRGRGNNGSSSGKKEKKPSKSNLPEKVCVVCGRPFTWRKKWERSWDEVTTCSKRCNSERRSMKDS
jgi:hypothetical protein